MPSRGAFVPFANRNRILTDRKRLDVTWWGGFSVASSSLPMVKLPPRIVFISGSRIAAASGVAGVAGGTG